MNLSLVREVAKPNETMSASILLPMTAFPLSFGVVTTNVFCIYVIRSTHATSLQQPAKIAITGLLFANLIQGLFVIPMYCIRKVFLAGHESNAASDAFLFAYIFTYYDSCLCILLITIDRVVSTRFPLRCHTMITSRKVLWALIVIAIYTLCLCLLPFMPSDSDNGRGRAYRPWLYESWIIFMLIVNNLIPFVVIVCSYFYILRKSGYLARELRSVKKLNYLSWNER